MLNRALRGNDGYVQDAWPVLSCALQGGTSLRGVCREVKGGQGERVTLDGVVTQ